MREHQTKTQAERTTASRPGDVRPWSLGLLGAGDGRDAGRSLGAGGFAGPDARTGGRELSGASDSRVEIERYRSWAIAVSSSTTAAAGLFYLMKTCEIFGLR